MGQNCSLQVVILGPNLGRLLRHDRFDYRTDRRSRGSWLSEPSGKFAIERVSDDVDRQAVDVGDTLMTRSQFIERHGAASWVTGGVLPRDLPSGRAASLLSGTVCGVIQRNRGRAWRFP